MELEVELHVVLVLVPENNQIVIPSKDAAKRLVTESIQDIVNDPVRRACEPARIPIVPEEIENMTVGEHLHLIQNCPNRFDS